MEENLHPKIDDKCLLPENTVYLTIGDITNTNDAKILPVDGFISLLDSIGW